MWKCGQNRFGRGMRCAIAAAGLAVAGVVGFGASRVAVADSGGEGFDLQSLKRMMETLKRKADAAREGSASGGEATSRPADTNSSRAAGAAMGGDGAAMGGDGAAVGDGGAMGGGQESASDGKAEDGARSARTDGVSIGEAWRGDQADSDGADSDRADSDRADSDPAGSDPAGSNVAETNGPVLRNTDGRPVDPGKAALREQEADDVLAAIRRAREARDAWLDDDPDPVLDALPAKPPQRRKRKAPSLTDPRIAPPPAETTTARTGPETAPTAPMAIETISPSVIEPAPEASSRQALGGPARDDERDRPGARSASFPADRDLLPLGTASNDRSRGIATLEPPMAARAVRGRAEPSRRVTVLLVMDVGKKGVRRWSKTADPMLCVRKFCFLSRGPMRSAVRHRRRAAFGPTIALGVRGLACRSSPACIFRNIDLGALEGPLQAIDLKFLRHDRREIKWVKADTSCGVEEGELVCDNPVEAGSWRAWIVPELVAELAGQKALKRALANGLQGKGPLAAKWR